MPDGRSLVILIAPNVSEQMGGEAIKALQIFREIKKQRPNTLQISHGRCRKDIERLAIADVNFIEDTPFSLLLWRSRIFRWALDPWFAIKAVSLAAKIARERGLTGNQVIIHQTLPNSPVVPRFVSHGHCNVFGPINGNIYYPTLFRKHESVKNRFRRIFHVPAQIINRCFFHGKTWADAVIYAGGERTKRSLLAGGYRASSLISTFDSGVDDEILDKERIKQSGKNLRFVHYGRLVFHKGTALVIEAMALTRLPITLDIIGQGPELARCHQLVNHLNLGSRINFIDWFPSHADLLSRLTQYRGMILPTFEDANGIVVQEAMAIGIPPICLDWGGPQLLIEDGLSGFLIKPSSIKEIVESIAECMDQLAEDALIAEKISKSARATAEKWRWSVLASSWISIYDSLLDTRYAGY